MAGLIDLHTHTNASDGTDAPSQLVQKAKDLGISVIGIADHDTTAGLAEAISVAAGLGDIEVVPAVELSTKDGSQTVHILGYFIKPDDTTLQEHFRFLISQRRVRMSRMIAKLRLSGIDLSPVVARRLLARNAPGRPHLADALIDHGVVKNRTDAFARYLTLGKPGYVPKPSLTPLEAIDIIKAAHGVPVLAHPLTPGLIEELPGKLQRYQSAGLLGMEVHYSLYDAPTRQSLQRFADEFGLIPTGGSDFHGDGKKPGPSLGEVSVPPESLARLRRAAGR